jgi:hypothetical protein
MCKKVLIATLAVVVALAVVKGTWVASHFRLWKQQLKASMRNKISPEQEIARLRMEVEALTREDDRHFDRVARQAVAVENLEKQVARLEKDLGERETRIRDMRTSLTGENEFVTYKGTRYSRTDLQSELRLAAAAFQADELTIQSKKQQLTAKKQAYELNRKKLAQLKLERQKMLTELQQLETALAQERQAQANEANTLNDGNYIKLRKEMDSIRDRIKVMQHKRDLKREVQGPVRANEERQEQDAKIDRFIENRFGDRAEKQ